MIIELGNHNALEDAVDDRPKVTTIQVPESDSEGLGGYTHKINSIEPDEFDEHVMDAILNRDRIFHLPDHEILISVTQEGWRHHAAPQRNLAYVGGKSPRTAHDDDLRPRWVRVRSHEELTGEKVGHSRKVAADVEDWLRRYYQLSDTAVKPPDLEDRYWTRWGAPGDGPALNDARALVTTDGRAQLAANSGGGSLGISGAGTAATATTLTTSSNLTQSYAGQRIYVMQTSTGPIIWGNIISNTQGVNSVVTVDRWYNAATPGGAAATTPSAGWNWIIADGGMPSAWFVALTTTNITPAVGDHTLSGEYTTASGGYIRKIAPYALTQGTSPVTYTLTPVYTGNGSDTYPSTFYAIGVFTSMVTSFGGAGGPMRFETAMNASATVAAIGDQVTVTETVTGP